MGSIKLGGCCSHLLQRLLRPLLDTDLAQKAGDVAEWIGGGLKNVALVYIDAAGVSRRAIIKSIAKGMVVGKVIDAVRAKYDGLLKEPFSY